MENQEFLIYRLLHASQEIVYSWLEENKPKKDESIFSSGSEELERALLSRNDPLVKLGLALYAHKEETGINLYRNSDVFLKKAVLSGTTIRPSLGYSWIESKGILTELIDSKNSELLGALLSNPFINDSILVNLYERKSYFEKLDDEFWFTLLIHTLKNSRLSTPYDKKWRDGWTEYSYSKVFFSGWELFEKLPANDRSAAFLARLGERLVPDKPPKMLVSSAIKRWEKESADESIDEFFDNFSLCRTALACLYNDYSNEFKTLKESKDIALRKSYYRRFKPLQKEEVRQLFKKDKSVFLDEAIHNDNLFKKSEIRQELEQCCWDDKDPDNRLYYVNSITYRIDHLKRKYPEWFSDNEDEDIVNPDDDPLEMLKIKILNVDQKITQIAEDLRKKNSTTHFFMWAIVGFLVVFFLVR